MQNFLINISFSNQNNFYTISSQKIDIFTLFDDFERIRQIKVLSFFIKEKNI